MLGKRRFGELERLIGYRFRHEDRLAEALVHRSYRFEHAGVDADNERLEFLGDAVLTLLAADRIYAACAGESEGVMTALRSRIVSGRTLASCAQAIDLGRFIEMGLGEERSGGRTRPSNLANALEAVVGAAYLDGGIRAASKVFDKLIAVQFAAAREADASDNPKGKLQEFAQSQWKASPVYEILEVLGPAHATEFTVRVTLADGRTATGHGRSKQAAEAAAAAQLLNEVAGAPDLDSTGGGGVE